MSTNHAKHVLSKAAEKCAQTGSKLTAKRSRILECLVNTSTPLSAYEVVDLYNEETDQPMPPMSAYRILDFLVSEQLAHKLSSENKYIACSHIACNHPHEIPQFLICRNCNAVKEIVIARSIIEQLSQNVSAAGYSLMNSQLELDCLCEQCITNAA